MAKKLPVYIWEPLFNRLTRISTEYAHKVLGIIPSSLTIYIQTRKYNKKLECYFTREPLSIKEKRQLIKKLEIPNEVWRETRLKGLYVSDHARFRKQTKNGWYYYIPFLKKGVPFIQYKGFRGKANRLIYETFYGNLSANEVVYSKNLQKYDVRANNLEKTTRQELGRLTAHLSQRRGIVFIGKNGELLDEFKSSREAEQVTLYNRQTICDSCNDTRNDYYSIGYRAFMWADEYEELNA